MSFEEEFDKIVRAKAEEENYPFDERNWEKTSSLIAADRKATRMLKLKKFYFPALLVIGLGSASIMVYSLIKPGEQELSLNEPTSVTTSSVASPVNAQADVDVINKELSRNELAKTVSAENRVQETISERSPDKNQHVSSINTQSSKISSTKKDHIVATRMGSVVSQNKNEETQEPQIKDAIDTKTESGQNNDTEHAGFANDVSVVSPKTVKTTSNTSPLANTNTSDKNESEENTIAATTDFVSSERQQLVSEQLVSVNSNLPHETTDRDILTTPFTILSRYDDDYYRNNLKKTHYLNIEAGANYLMGWDTRNGKDAKGLNWFGGLNYGFYLTQKISLGIGVQAYNISNIKQAFYMNELKEYSFGSSTSYTVISSNDLYYLALPLKMNYHLNSSNTVGFGVNAAYLMSAANTVSTYSVNQENGASLPVSMRNAGIYEGTRLTNLMISAHYNAKLTKRLSVNAELNYGLTDIFENKGSITNKETPLGLRLSLQYTLFDK